MQTLQVDLGERSYPITIGAQLIDQAELLSRHIRGKQVAIVTNDTVAPLYLERLKRSLAGKPAKKAASAEEDDEAEQASEEQAPPKRASGKSTASKKAPAKSTTSKTASGSKSTTTSKSTASKSGSKKAS